MDDGFQILSIICLKISPQLGGYGDDSYIIINNFKVDTDDTVDTLFDNVTSTYNIIQLQQEGVNITNRLIGKYIHILYIKQELQLPLILSLINGRNTKQIKI